MATWQTSDGKDIRPGLRVFTNDAKWGRVCPEQFTDPSVSAPGGKFFTGWFRVKLEDGPVVLYNGERLRTTRTPGLR